MKYIVDINVRYTAELDIEDENKIDEIVGELDLENYNESYREVYDYRKAKQYFVVMRWEIISATKRQGRKTITFDTKKEALEYIRNQELEPNVEYDIKEIWE